MPMSSSVQNLNPTYMAKQVETRNRSREFKWYFFQDIDVQAAPPRNAISDTIS
jgi:hypothetical protein